LSTDPRFEEKLLIDVIRLYLAPPEKSIVLFLDEKSSEQALGRTQPSLPMKKGRAQTMTSATSATAPPRRAGIGRRRVIANAFSAGFHCTAHHAHHARPARWDPVTGWPSPPRPG
jgi:hypothetical protein